MKNVIRDKDFIKALHSSVSGSLNKKKKKINK